MNGILNCQQSPCPQSSVLDLKEGWVFMKFEHRNVSKYIIWYKHLQGFGSDLLSSRKHECFQNQDYFRGLKTWAHPACILFFFSGDHYPATWSVYFSCAPPHHHHPPRWVCSLFSPFNCKFALFKPLPLHPPFQHPHKVLLTFPLCFLWCRSFENDMELLQLLEGSRLYQIYLWGT